jgi:hypothetical protein
MAEQPIADTRGEPSALKKEGKVMAQEKPERRRNTWVIVVVVVLVLVVCGCLTVAGVGWLATSRGWSWLRRPEPRELTTGRGWVPAERELEESFSVSVPVLVDVSNDVGAISIVGTKEESVRVRGLVRAWGTSRILAEDIADEVSVEIRQIDETHIEVVGRNPRDVTRVRTPSLDLTLYVPHECAIEVVNNVGKLGVENIVGSVQAEVKVGEIDVRNLVMTGSTFLSTITGRIRISLPETSEFYIDARTNVGRIDCDFDMRHLQDTRTGVSHQLEGPVGIDPEVELTLSSKTGGISIVESR